MALLDQLNTELVEATKQNDPLKRDTLRLLKTAIKNSSIQKGHELGDEEILEVLAKEVKQRQDSITAFEGAGRTELADKEKSELAIIQAYLPEQMNDQELTDLIDQAIASTGATAMNDMGKVMAALMPQTKGRADGNKVSQLVRSRLSSQ